MAGIMVGNYCFRINRLAKAGDPTPGHTHNFDHPTVIIKGSVRITVTRPDLTEYTEDYYAGGYLNVPKDHCHHIVALEDDTLYYCIYAPRTPDGELSDGFTGYQEGYR